MFYMNEPDSLRSSLSRDLRKQNLYQLCSCIAEVLIKFVVQLVINEHHEKYKKKHIFKLNPD